MEKLELKNVYKHYVQGTVEAVKDLSLSLKSGELLAILGPSGCGKSSTLRMIAGIEDITKGEIYLDGEIINWLSAKERNIALAFETYALYPHLSLFENIAFPLRIRGRKDQEVRKEVKRIADMLEITNVLSKLPSEVSGGHQQRTSLARALIRPASLYLLDEPLSHLDTQQRTEFRVQIKRIQKTQNLTMLFVTHDQLEALALADRIAVLNLGVLQQIGTPEEVYEYPENLFVADFVGEPPMNFIKATLVREENDYMAKLYNQKLKIPENYKDSIEKFYKGDVIEIMLGIRPIYIYISEPVEGQTVSGEVYVFEDIGESGILTVQIGDALIRVELNPGYSFKLGEKVNITFDLEKILIFNPTTGERIKANYSKSAK
ncbi:MAG: ABC transporter ATP-binding protein [Candidatus Atribacteria bacterium]|nr:ABC transporter ATP-binding protein [bacterium]MCG2762208.1 ABC transporter ATP-binding protein [Candidatus Atribacteria bacterium]